MTGTLALGSLLFPRAAEEWLETRKPFIAPRTFKEYAQYIKTLSLFFGELKLSEIYSDNIRAYQKMRAGRACPTRINQECSVIQQMLKRIGRWKEIDYQPLPAQRSQRGRALTDEEYDRLFRIAASRPTWEMAYLFALISVNTSAGPKEVFTLRLQDVDVAGRAIRVQPEGAKNVYRVRVIPLNDAAFAAIQRVLELAKQRGSVRPEHYVFPFRVKGNPYCGTYDPTRHCTTCKAAWAELTERAGLKGLRPYDMRHTIITDMLGNPDISEETVKSIAGHVSQHILKTYSHIRLEKKRAALFALSHTRSGPPLPRQEERPSLTNSDVVEMANDFSPEVIVAKIKAGPCRFNTYPETLKQLKASGVPDSVILAMVKAG